MAMRDYEDLKDIQIPKEQEEMMDIFTAAWQECSSGDCMACPDRPKKEMRMVCCMSLKFARLLVEAGYRRDEVPQIQKPFDYMKNCETCIHRETDLTEKPCRLCDGSLNYEESNEEE